MELLKKIEDGGYPTEYLLSRIRGRRAYLIKDWTPLLLGANPSEYLSPARYGGLVTTALPEGIWRLLLLEHMWVYFQMNGSLREAFSPFFLYTELKTIFMCLRFRKTGETAKIENLLSVSLLSEKIKRILKKKGDVPSAIEGIEKVFTSLSYRFKGLKKLAEARGLQEVELQLTNRYLMYLADSRLHPVMRDFFVRIIDARNILSLYKHMSLNAKDAPQFIRGGSIREKDFMEAIGEKDFYKALSLIRRSTGIAGEEPRGTEIEHFLYRHITGLLRRSGRDPLGAALVLDYLWRCSIEARNLSILFQAGEIDRDALARELIQ